MNLMSLRSIQRERGREIIRTAAEELFLTDGYAGTPVTAIAKRAGVAEKTVYNLFETKSGLLLDLFAARVADLVTSTSTREEDVVGSLSADDIIDDFCRINLGVAAEMYPLVRVIMEAGASDPDVAGRHAAQEEYRKRDQASLLERLEPTGRLRTDIPREELIRRMWLAAAPELVVKAIDNGWTLEEHSKWLGETLRAHLLKR